MHLLPPLALLLLALPALSWSADEAAAEELAAEELAAEVEELPPLVVNPELVTFVDAPYPPAAVDAGIEGVVLLLIELDELGAVTAVEILESAGHGFDEAAEQAAWQLVFTPAQDEQGPVPVALEFEYGFTLDSLPPPLEPDTPAPPLPVNLEGTVLEAGTRIPLEGIALWILVDGERVDTRSDVTGHWAFHGVPDGEIEVHATWPGYEELAEKVEVVPGEVTELRLWMTNRDYDGGEMVGLYYRDREPDITRRTISIAEVRRVPGTFGDPVRVIQSLPGAARSSFGSSQLILRGANPEDSNVYIDGVEVPIIFHMGGYRSVINPALIASVDYLPGGYGVRYGRSIGGVVDVQTSDEYPERRTATWHTDVLDSSLYTTGRVGKEQQLGFAAGIRRSYLDVLMQPFLPDDAPTIKPRWFDYQVKGQTLTKGPNDFSLLFFGFHDLMLIQNPDDFSVGTDEEGTDGLAFAYQTHRMVGTWRREISPTLDLFVRPVFGWDDTALDMATMVSMKIRSTQLGLRSELRWRPNEAWQVTGGVDASSSRFDMSVDMSGFAMSMDDPLAEEDDFSSSDNGWSHAPDPYLDLQLRPLEEPEALVFDLGVRLETSIVSGMDPLLGLDPRFAMRWELVPGGTLRAGTGLYQQHPEQRVMAFGGGNTALPLERAWSSELGWLQRFGTAGSADITGFYKEIDRLGVFNPDLQDFFTDDLYVPDGAGRVYGLEMLLRKEPTGPLFGWISYTLSRSLREDGDGEWYRFDYDQTHILTGIAGYGFPWDFDVSTRLQYVTGNPYTPYDDAVFNVDTGSYTAVESAARNSARMGAYFSADLRVSKMWAFKRYTLEMFFDILNVVHAQNPEMIIYNYDYSESTIVQGLPIIPSLGFEAEFTF